MTDEPKPQEQDDEETVEDYNNHGDPGYYDRYTEEADEKEYMRQSDPFGPSNPYRGYP